MTYLDLHRLRQERRSTGRPDLFSLAVVGAMFGFFLAEAQPGGFLGVQGGLIGFAMVFGGGLLLLLLDQRRGRREKPAEGYAEKMLRGKLDPDDRALILALLNASGVSTGRL